jgi:ankyrin repeat protein
MTKTTWMIVLGLLAIFVVFAVLVWRMPKDERLRQAAARGDTSQVRGLLMRGVNINSHNRDGSTALMFASASGHAETVRELLHLGAAVDINAHPGLHDTALYYAVLNDHPDVAALLLEAGADPNARMGGTYSPIVIASRECAVDMLRTLTSSAKTNVNVRDGRGNTPLMLALLSGSSPEQKAASLELLVAHGGDILAANSAGETPCSLACQQKQSRLIAALGKCACEMPQEMVH